MLPALPFSYQIRRSRRKSLGIVVKNATVEVRAPMHMPMVNIQQWLVEKSAWVEKHLSQQQQQIAEKPAVVDQGWLLFMGEPKGLSIIQGTAGIYEHHQRLIISCHKPEKAQRLLEEWLRCEAELYLTARTQELAQLMGDNNKIHDIRFRKTRSKWGHCTSAGVLQFNWLIIMAPPQVIDYLIIHELSHLSHMNHSTAFWQRVSQFCPDYSEHKQWLRMNGHKLWL